MVKSKKALHDLGVVGLQKPVDWAGLECHVGKRTA